MCLPLVEGGWGNVGARAATGQLQEGPLETSEVPSSSDSPQYPKP